MVWHIQDNNIQQSHQDGEGVTAQGCWWSNPGMCQLDTLDTTRENTLPEEEILKGGEEGDG